MICAIVDCIADAISQSTESLCIRKLPLKGQLLRFAYLIFQSTLTEKELEAAHVLTVVQDAESLLYTVNMNNTDKKPLTEMKETPKMEPVQNS